MSENNPALNIAIFAVFVGITMVVVLRASRNNKTASDYYAGGRSFTIPAGSPAEAHGTYRVRVDRLASGPVPAHTVFSEPVTIRADAVTTPFGWLTPLLGALVAFDLTSFWMIAWSVRELVPAHYVSLLGGLIIKN